jgi:ubiquinone/menaquinone biosynthesis C-methylase UbiE/acyl carrier protein
VKEEGSYKIQSFAANVDNEIRRLKAQVELFWPKERACLERAGLRDGMAILEAGSGPGHLLEKLLEAFPASPVTGVEVDPFLVETSRKVLATSSGDRCRVFEQSITKMDFPDGTFDFVIARLVLEHLTRPLDAIVEVRRVLKTGGKAVFIDNDFDMHLRSYPEIPELKTLYEAYCRKRTDEGGNPRIGRELPGLLQMGGFSNVDLEIVSAHSRVIGDEAFLRSEGSGIPAQLVKDGYLARDMMERLARRWHEALKQKHHVFFRQLFLAVGENLPAAAITLDQAAAMTPATARSPEAAAILGAAGAEEKKRLLASYLCGLVASALKTEPERLPTDRALIELGVDSITSVELANRLGADLGLKISAVDILEASSVEAAAAGLTASLDGTGRPGADKASGAPGGGKDWEEGEI